MPKIKLKTSTEYYTDDLVKLLNKNSKKYFVVSVNETHMACCSGDQHRSYVVIEKNIKKVIKRLKKIREKNYFTDERAKDSNELDKDEIYEYMTTNKEYFYYNMCCRTGFGDDGEDSVAIEIYNLKKKHIKKIRKKMGFTVKKYHDKYDKDKGYEYTKKIYDDGKDTSNTSDMED